MGADADYMTWSAVVVAEPEEATSITTMTSLLSSPLPITPEHLLIHTSEGGSTISVDF
jgi:hypothetical protein